MSDIEEEKKKIERELLQRFYTVSSSFEYQSDIIDQIMNERFDGRGLQTRYANVTDEPNYSLT